MNLNQLKGGSMKQIFSTIEYEKFRFLGENRNVIPHKVERLKRAIVEKNLLSAYPIVVTAGFEVLDGQHRLRAASGLGVPIFYIIEPLATVKDIAATNSLQSQWKMIDYVHYYVKLGQPEYILIIQFIQKYNIGLDTALSALGLRGGDVNRFIKAGTIIVSDRLPFAEKVIKHCEDFQPFKLCYNRSFVMALKRLMGHSFYNTATMRSKLQNQPRAIVPCADAEMYYLLFVEIYNYRNKNYIQFTAWPKLKQEEQTQ